MLQEAGDLWREHRAHARANRLAELRLHKILQFVVCHLLWVCTRKKKCFEFF